MSVQKKEMEINIFDSVKKKSKLMKIIKCVNPSQFIQRVCKKKKLLSTSNGEKLNSRTQMKDLPWQFSEHFNSNIKPQSPPYQKGVGTFLEKQFVHVKPI